MLVTEGAPDSQNIRRHDRKEAAVKQVQIKRPRPAPGPAPIDLRTPSGRSLPF
jgi:hypothetical protein